MAQRMSAGWWTSGAARPGLRAGLLCAAMAIGLGGCGSVSEKMAGPMSTLPGIGMRAEAPERPAQALAYPAVHDMPPPRTTATLDGPAQQQMEKELVEARDRQRAATTPSTAARKPAPRPGAPPPRVVPTSSSQVVY
jgi:hypothetical protein